MENNVMRIVMWYCIICVTLLIGALCVSLVANDEAINIIVGTLIVINVVAIAILWWPTRKTKDDKAKEDQNDQ